MFIISSVSKASPLLMLNISSCLHLKCTSPSWPSWKKRFFWVRLSSSSWSKTTTPNMKIYLLDCKILWCLTVSAFPRIPFFAMPNLSAIASTTLMQLGLKTNHHSFLARVCVHWFNKRASHSVREEPPENERRDANPKPKKEPTGQKQLLRLWLVTSLRAFTVIKWNKERPNLAQHLLLASKQIAVNVISVETWWNLAVTVAANKVVFCASIRIELFKWQTTMTNWMLSSTRKLRW